MTSLGDVCELIVDSEHKTAPKASSGHPLVRTTDIELGRLNLRDAQQVDEAAYRSWTLRAVPQPEDLILAREAPVGNVGIIPLGAEPCLGQRTVLLRPSRERIEPRFLNYLLSSPDLRGRMDGLSNGATVPHLNMRDIRSLELPPLPPLSTQRRIASILSAYDDLIENNTRRIQILEEMAQAIYREWFVEFRFPGHERVRMVDSELGPIPEGWTVRTFTEVADVLSGGTPSTREKTFWNGDIPFFTPRDAPDTLAVLDTERHITPEGLESCRSDCFAAGTVFITARGTVGKVVTPAIPMALNQSCYAIRGRDDMSQDYLLHLLKNSVGYLTTNAGGATFDTIIIDTFRRMRVLHPPHRIINGFDQLAHPLRELEVRLLSINANLRLTRDLLLPRLISGEIDVSDLDIGDAAPAA